MPAVTRSPPRNTGGCRFLRRRGRNARNADELTPAKWARSATAEPWCAPNIAKCARFPDRRRTECRERSTRSRLRWWQGRRVGRCAARTLCVARQQTVARTAGRFRCCEDADRVKRLRCREFRVRRRGRPRCRLRPPRSARRPPRRPRRRDRGRR